jgi:hypothetical protein
VPRQAPQQENAMNGVIVASLMVLLSAGVKHEDAAAEAKEDAKRHREFAEIHLKAADCLETSKDPAPCEEALKKACKGKASGPHCGMRHEH